MELTWALLILFFSFIFILSYFSLRKATTATNLPGPSFYQVLGNLHKVGTVEFGKLLTDWARQYGDIYQYHIFGQRFVVLNTAELIKTGYNEESRTHVVPYTPFEYYNGGSFGIGASVGKDWLEQRKFAVQNLKTFGFKGAGGAPNARLYQDVDDILSDMAKKEGLPLEISEEFLIPVLNLAWGITTSARLSKEDISLVRRFHKHFATFLFGKINTFFAPIIQLLKLEPGYMKRFKAVTLEFRAIKNKIIQDRLAVFKSDVTAEPKDFVDAFLHKKLEDESNGRASSFNGNNWMKHLRGQLMDINMAGASTVFHVFQGGILELIQRPELQRKIQQQIDSVMGRDQSPTLQDRSSLPLVDAFILEVLRPGNSSAPFAFHIARQDSKLLDHFIPKGTIIVGNIDASHHNEKLWDEPQSFNPDRFIDPTTGEIINSELIVSFSAGRHKCPGEQIAKEILFLLFSKILQKYKVETSPEFPITDTKPYLGFFMTVPEFHAVFSPRG